MKVLNLTERIEFDSGPEYRVYTAILKSQYKNYKEERHFDENKKKIVASITCSNEERYLTVGGHRNGQNQRSTNKRNLIKQHDFNSIR